MSAILFGSISTIADTSELQRSAFNAAFEEHGLDWTWGREEYVDLLQGSGGAARISDYAEKQGVEVDAKAVHSTKSRIFQESLTGNTISPRPGVVETIAWAKEHGTKLALVTTTSPENVAALFSALGSEVAKDSFDLVVDTTSVSSPKPDPAAYAFALHSLAESPEAAVAIEDNLGGVEAAVTAGVQVVAFPNQNTVGHDFALAGSTTDHLDPAELSTLAGAK